MTYSELNERANRLAYHLRTLGVGPEVPVGLCMERSPELVVGLLGILKAGGVFLPLDPALPAERLAFMLEDARARVVLTLQHIYDLRFTIYDLPAELKTQNSKLKTPVVLCLDAVWEQLAHQPVQPPVTELTAANLAYLIYTSGTTGRPKAVMVEHRTLINTCCASQQQFAFTAQDVMPWIASAAFDIALFEILNPLLAGGTVLVLPQHRILDLPQLARDLADVTVFHAVPGLMRQIVETIHVLIPNIQLYDRMRAVFIGGDRVPAELPAQVQSVFRRAQIYPQYGPTEGTIICTRYRCLMTSSRDT